MAQAYKGGPGSGNHDHLGRPGKVGGSATSGSAGHSSPPGWGVIEPRRSVSYDQPQDVEPEVWSAASGWGNHASSVANRMRDSGDAMLVTRGNNGQPEGALSYRRHERENGPLLEAQYAIAEPKADGANWRLTKALAKQALNLGAMILVSSVVSTALFPTNFVECIKLLEGLNHYDPTAPLSAGLEIGPDTLQRIARGQAG